MTEYSNTHIYKLECLDADIKEIYIGHTTNPKQRNWNHCVLSNSNSSNKSNRKLYEFIRNNGGYDRWTMTIIEKLDCNTYQEVLRREQYWMNELKPTLNSIKANQTPEEYREYKNAWKRNSDSHHKYNREYAKNLTPEQKARNTETRRLRIANMTPEQKEIRNAKRRESYIKKREAEGRVFLTR